jgi:hypothetical protein
MPLPQQIKFTANKAAHTAQFVCWTRLTARLTARLWRQR